MGQDSLDGRVKVKNKTNIKNKNLPFSIGDQGTQMPVPTTGVALWYNKRT